MKCPYCHKEGAVYKPDYNLTSCPHCAYEGDAEGRFHTTRDKLIAESTEEGRQIPHEPSRVTIVGRVVSMDYDNTRITVCKPGMEGRHWADLRIGQKVVLMSHTTYAELFTHARKAGYKGQWDE